MAEKIARLHTVTEVAPGVLLCGLEMVSPPELTFRAGQFLSVRLSPEGDVRRSYSIASSPARRTGIELLVKLVPTGAGSAFFRRLSPGDELHFTGPMGFFTVDLVHTGDVVFAVTGAGIAAALPMLEEILARSIAPTHARVLLFWGLRSEKDLYFQDRLAHLAAADGRFAYHVCLSQPGPSWAGVDGRITRHVLDRIPTLHGPLFYLVGNGEMVSDLIRGLGARGFDRKRHIRTEVFYPVAEP